MKKLTFLIFSLLGIVLAQNKPNTIALRPIQTDTDSVFVINSSKDLYYIKVKTNTGAILGAVNLSMSPTAGDLSLTIGGTTYTANLGTQNDFESATYSIATGEITLTANDGTNTVLTIDGSETKLTGGAGISLTGNGTSATPYNVEALDASPTNELQTLGLSGSVLSISGANSLTLPNTSASLNARAYASPDSALFWNGDSLYLDDFSAVAAQYSKSTWNASSTSQPSNDINDRAYRFGDVSIGFPTIVPSNTLHIQSATVANTGGVRLPITSASTAQTGQPIGVNASGDVVRIAPSASGITSLGGQTGLTQTLSVTNTTAARAWTSLANDHSLNLRAWDLNGNTGTNQALNFVGTTDAVDLAFRTSNTERMRIYQNGGVGIGTTTPAAKVLGSELSVQTGGFTRVSATHTTTGTTGRSEFFAGTSTASGFGAFGYANAGFASPFTGVATAYSYLALSAATDLLIGQNGNAQPMWEFKATTGNTGIGTNNPQVKLDVNGGIATEVRTVTVSGALVVADHVTLINNGATAFTVTLPAAASFVGRHIIVKRIDNTSTGTITINTAGGSVQALAGTLAATTSLAAIGTYGQAAHFISNGTNWYLIN